MEIIMRVRYLQLDFEDEVDWLDGLYCPVDYLQLDDEERGV